MWHIARLLLVALLAVHHVQGAYHSLGDILHWFSHAAGAHKDYLKFEEIREKGSSHAPIPFVTIANNTPGVAEPTSDRPVALLIFGEHAREIITTDTGLWLAKVLVGDVADIARWPEMQPVLQGMGITGSAESALKQWASFIVNHMIVKVLPVENIEGRREWEGGSLCLRKTPGGVDLNRNYPFAWRKEDSFSDMYGGPEPFSEPHSRLVRDIALAAPPRTFINVHSGEWAIYTPWDSKKAIGPGLPADLDEMLQRTASVCNCQAGPAGAVSDYLAFGTSMDYMYTQLGVPYALTLELYGAGNVGQLAGGQKNQRLEDFPFTSDDGIARSLPSRTLAAAGSAYVRREVGVSGHPGGWLMRASGRTQLRKSLRGLAQAGQQQQQQVHHQVGEQIKRLVESKPMAMRRCFTQYNPPEGAEYRNVVARWVVAMLLMLRHAADPAHPKPSLHPLPGTVLAGAGVSTAASAGRHLNQHAYGLGSTDGISSSSGGGGGGLLGVAAAGAGLGPMDVAGSGSVGEAFAGMYGASLLLRSSADASLHAHGSVSLSHTAAERRVLTQPQAASSSTTGQGAAGQDASSARAQPEGGDKREVVEEKGSKADSKGTAAGGTASKPGTWSAGSDSKKGSASVSQSMTAAKALAAGSGERTGATQGDGRRGGLMGSRGADPASQQAIQKQDVAQSSGILRGGAPSGTKKTSSRHELVDALNQDAQVMQLAGLARLGVSVEGNDAFDIAGSHVQGQAGLGQGRASVGGQGYAPSSSSGGVAALDSLSMYDPDGDDAGEDADGHADNSGGRVASSAGSAQEGSRAKQDSREGSSSRSRRSSRSSSSQQAGQTSGASIHSAANKRQRGRQQGRGRQHAEGRAARQRSHLHRGAARAHAHDAAIKSEIEAEAGSGSEIKVSDPDAQIADGREDSQALAEPYMDSDAEIYEEDEQDENAESSNEDGKHNARGHARGSASGIGKGRAPSDSHRGHEPLYRTSPEMRQHSIVVALGLLGLAAIVAPVYVCQMRPITPHAGSRRKLPGLPPASRTVSL